MEDKPPIDPASFIIGRLRADTKAEQGPFANDEGQSRDLLAERNLDMAALRVITACESFLILAAGQPAKMVVPFLLKLGMKSEVRCLFKVSELEVNRATWAEIRDHIK